MARPQRKSPKPYIRHLGNSWKLRWSVQGEKRQEYQITLGDISKEKAELICAATAAAFDNRADFPDEVRDNPVIKRWVAISNDLEADVSDMALIDKYIAHKCANCSSDWPRTVKMHLKNAAKYIGTIQHATTRQLNEFLDHIAIKNSPATRNRAQASLSGFFNWLRKTGYMPKSYNPLEGIKQAREERPEDGIIIWEINEVRKLLRRARRRKDGIAIWIGILAGLRRGEIARLRWRHITESYIIVEKSKTGRKRQVPMSPLLYAELIKSKENPRIFGEKNMTERAEKHEQKRIEAYRKTGLVVPWPESNGGWETAARRMVDIHLPNLFPKLHKESPEKFNWNPFRHTFASRHAQNGVPLDVIAAWLGDSPKVCKEHYARYVPKKLRDTRIDSADEKLANIDHCGAGQAPFGACPLLFSKKANWCSCFCSSKAFVACHAHPARIFRKGNAYAIT